MSWDVLPRITSWGQSHARGLALAGVVALAALALASQYGVPVTLMALMLGLAVNFLSEDPRVSPGLDFAASTLLKIGVAVLGLTVPVMAILGLGLLGLLKVTGLIAVSLLMALAIGRFLGISRDDALVAGSAVGICGASAALAASSVLNPKASQKLPTTVAIATALSTLAMVTYPVVLDLFGMTPHETGFVLGATIHDVAQVVGAGYSVSEEVGTFAVFVKMVRVAHLPLVLLLLSLLPKSAGETGPRGMPGFVTVFVIFTAIAATGLLPVWVADAASNASRFCFVVAIAAIGLRTDLRSAVTSGKGHFVMIGGATLVLFFAGVLLAE
ncbi:MAG: YeiH family protein [Mangrovicoccus sp.]